MEHIKIWGSKVPGNRLKGVAIGAGMALVAAGGAPIAAGVMDPLLAGLVLSAAILGPLIGWAIYMARPGHVHIGTDGLLVSRHEGKRYIPFDAVDEVAPFSERLAGQVWVGAELRLRGGEQLVLPVGHDLPERRDRADLLVQQLNRALIQFERCVAGGAQDVTALERGDRSPEQWLQALRGVGEGDHAHHREASMPVDRLWEILENPSAPERARASAAAALRPRLDADGERRVRVALDDTAAPKLRVALESALARDDEALAVALDELGRDAEEAHES